MNDTRYEFFAAAPKGIEPILQEELRGLGAGESRVTAGGVHFSGPLVLALRACLWSRTAGRVLFSLGRYPVGGTADISEALRSIPWEEHVPPGKTLAVDFNGTGSGIDNTMYGALLVKDAVVDRLRERRGARPDVEPKNPDLLVNCHLSRGRLGVHIDLSGESLHLRGYRQDLVAAPLRENLAAALLIKSGWPAVAADGGTLIDLMCGSGTFVIEAALMGADIAPGLQRTRWGFTGWQGNDSAAWSGLIEEARERGEAGMARAPRCYGFDADPRAIRAAAHNAGRAGVVNLVQFEKRALEAAESKPEYRPGLIVTNPPYGKRMDAEEDLPALYARLGDTLKRRFPGWRAAVFTGEPELGKRMGLRAVRVNRFYNGAIPCALLQFNIEPESFVDRDALDERAAIIGLDRAMKRGAEAFYNRIKKNMRTVGRWAAREGISCYRLYDADLPEYAVAVDIYDGWALVYEYAPPATVDAARAGQRLEDILTVLPGALGIESGRVVLKIRRRQKGADQYEKQGDRGAFMEVREGGCRLLVNLTDYLDTGLFLDHRLTREMIGREAAGKRFLNLFCYTGAATVHAAAGGARSTVSVDLSPVYLDWARRNLELNGARGKNHRLMQADCREWIGDCPERFDVIFLDPPTFSNSKRMRGSFDIQRDHVPLIRDTLRLLAPGGVLFFSANRQRFKLDEGALADASVEDISARTIPRDFERSPRIHRCWRISPS